MYNWFRSTGPVSFYQNSCLLVCYVFLKHFPFVGCYVESSVYELYLAQQLLFWIGYLFGNAHIYVECKNNLFSKYLMNFFWL